MSEPIRARIVDDEDHCRSSLSKQIEWSCEDVEIIGTASSAKEAKKLILELRPDIVFLDIEMPGGSGFDLLDSLDEIKFSIIFTTAYDEYALKAFKVNALAYLLKPIDGEELAAAVEKSRSEHTDQMGKKLEQLMSYLRMQGASTKKVAFPVSEGLEFVVVDDIVRCESEGSYCHIYIHNQSKLFLSKTLKQVSELISSEKFVRVHHSHLVNMDHVKKYIRGKGGQVIMDDGTSIPVSRTKKDGFLDTLR